jgi:hypothetical protein
VVLDNFLYGPDTEKNAPDVIGLKNQKGEIIAVFTQFKDGSWIFKKDMPVIEVKTFRQDQYLTAVNDTQLDDNHYYVFIESHVREDYLTTLFEDEVFSKKIYDNLKMSKDFILSDKENQIILPEPIKKINNLGYFKLIGIYTGSEVKKYSFLAKGNNSSGNPDKFRYLSDIEEITEKKDKENKLIPQGIFMDGDKYVPMYVEYCSKNSKLRLLQKFKGNMKVKVVGAIKINGYSLQDGYYRINFKYFDKKSRKNEYFGDKNVFENVAKDVRSELIERFDNIMSKKIN